MVATREEELARLEELYRRGTGNGLTDLRYLNPQEIREVEPHCVGLKALYVPQAGIVNYVEVAEKYAEKIRELGAEIFLGESALDIRMHSHSVDVVSSTQTINAKTVVVCAGIYSDRLARTAIPDLSVGVNGYGCHTGCAVLEQRLGTTWFCVVVCRVLCSVVPSSGAV